MRIPYVDIARLMSTAGLLIWVYQGSRLALVVVLALLCIANELSARDKR